MVGPDPALARPYRARVKPTRVQGQAEGGPALRVRVRASKNGLDPARPGPWSVYLSLMILKMAASSLLEIPVSGCGPVEDSDIIERGIDLFKIVLTKLLRT